MIYIYIEKWISLTPNSVSGTSADAFRVDAVGYPDSIPNPIIKYSSGQYYLEGTFSVKNPNLTKVGYVQARFIQHAFALAPQSPEPVFDSKSKHIIFNIGSKSIFDGLDIQLNAGDKLSGIIYFYETKSTGTLFAYSLIRQADVL
jgi:hypothetical protein